MQPQTVLSNNGFPKYLQADVAVFIARCFLMQCLLRAWRSHTFNGGFLTRTEMSLESLDLFAILCTVDFKIILCSLAPSNVLSELINNSLMKLGTKWGETWSSHLFSTNLLFVDCVKVANPKNQPAYSESSVTHSLLVTTLSSWGSLWIWSLSQEHLVRGRNTLTGRHKRIHSYLGTIYYSQTTYCHVFGRQEETGHLRC